MRLYKLILLVKFCKAIPSIFFKIYYRDKIILSKVITKKIYTKSLLSLPPTI